MDDLLTDFIAEVREMLAGCEEAIVAWEADPADGARLDTIFRFVHTVKGNCGFFDLPRLAALSHAAEDALGDVRAGRRVPDADLVTAILAIIDRLAELTQALEDGEDLAAGNDADLIAALRPDAQPVPVRQQPEDAPAAALAPTSNQTTSRSIRVPVELLDEVMSGMSDMVLARNDFDRRLRMAGASAELDSAFARLSGILADVRGSVTRMRMNRFDQLFLSIPRLVRDLAHELGKQASVTFAGGDVELDREIMELIRDPITHILRNALDHGIELPELRRAAGKPMAGTLAVSARHSGNEVCLTIADDGRGIDPQRIAAAAVEAGLASAADVAQLSREQQLNLIFTPGLSTAGQVSAISGRGVGMDVVRANLQRIGGNIAVQSVAGERTEFHLTVPLTLSIISGIIVETGGQQIAIPQSYVTEVVRNGGSNMAHTWAGDTQLVAYRGVHIPYLALHEVLGLPAPPTGMQPAALPRTVIILQTGDDERFAIGVDRISDHEDLVVKPLGPDLMRIGVYAGVTLLGDGKPILLLDVRGLAQRHALFAAERHGLALQDRQDAQAGAAPAGDMALLFTGIDGTERAVRFAALERVHLLRAEQIDRHGAQAVAAVDGHLLPLHGLAGDHPPAVFSALRLGDGGRRVLYAVAAVGDCIAIGALHTADPHDRAHEGLLLIDERPVRLLDMNWLLGTAAPARQDHQLTCALPDDQWARTILAPLLSAAGYRIALPGTGPADVLIALDGVLPSASGERVLHLTSDVHGAPPGVIHRSDRGKLLATLAEITAGARA